MISRKSFTDDDVERLAETIAQLDFKQEIHDRDSFNRIFDNYMGETGAELREDQTSRDRVFKEFVQEYPNRITQPEDLQEKKEVEPVVKKANKREFSHLGKSGNRIVFLRKSFEDRDGRKQIIFRDRFGKIGTPKNPKDADPLKD